MTERALAGRLFLAVPLTEDVRSGLVEHLDRALGGRDIPGRRVPPQNWHLTLKFLGDTPWDAYERLIEALEGAQLGAPFTLGFDRLGAFPRPQRARVLWLGTSRAVDRLREVASATERCAVEAGFEPERRPFSAHLTLSRLRPEKDVRELLDRMGPFDMRLPVQDVVIYRSHLSRSGARYEPLNRFELLPAADTTSDD